MLFVRFNDIFLVNSRAEMNLKGQYRHDQQGMESEC